MVAVRPKSGLFKMIVPVAEASPVKRANVTAQELSEKLDVAL